MGQVLSQSPLTDTLHRLSENLLTAQDQSQDLRKRFDTLELSAEATERKENSALRDVPEGLLHFYLNQCKVGAHLSQTQEASLLEYRDQLSAFDQTIQEYQDMLDGKTALPEQMKLEEVSNLLEATKAAWEQFLQKGAAELNRLSNEGPTPKESMGSVYNMLVEDDGTGDGDTRWQIDPDAQDIYGEIDRALVSAHKATSTFQTGASNILAELKRRGCVQEGEDFALDDLKSMDTGRDKWVSLFQDIYSEIWNAFSPNTGKKSE